VDGFDLVENCCPYSRCPIISPKQIILAQLALIHIPHNKAAIEMGANGLVATGVPPQPLWLLYIKIAILVLSLIILAIAAYALSIWPFGAGGLDIFVVSKTSKPTPLAC